MVAAALRQRRRLWLASLAIALSVGYLAGALTLLNRVSVGLTDLSAAGIERADLVIEGDVAYESALEQTRRLITSSIALSLVGEPGIASAIPRVEDIAVILGSDGGSVVTPGLTEQPIGANWPDDAHMSPYEFVGEGRAPTGPDEVVIDQRSAEKAGVGVGDTVGIVARSEVGRFRIVGMVNTERGELPAGSSLALFETGRARELFSMEDTDTRVAIRLSEGADLGAVRASIEESLPYGAVVVTGDEAAIHRQESINRSFTLVRSLIMGFAGLALLVGMVTAANSLTLLYSQRRLTFATFRLVGAKRYQIMGAALAEAALLASVASLAGAPVGMVLGALIEGVLGGLGTPIPVGGSRVSLSALVIAVVVGAVATVLAAVVPAWRACSTPAIEAIVPVEAAPPRRLRQRLIKLAAVAVSVGLVGWALSVITEIGEGRRLQLTVGLMVAVVVLWSIPMALSYAVAGGILVFPESSGTLKRIGARDALRNRTRTAATTGALLLATAVVSGIAVFLSSFSAALDGDVAQLIRADLVVDSGTFTVGGLPKQLLNDIDRLDGVDAVSGWQIGRVYIDEVPARLTGMDGDALGRVLSPGWIGAAPDVLEFDGIALSKAFADELGVIVGDAVAVRFTSEETVMMTVQGVYNKGDVLLGSAIVDRTMLSAQIPKSYDLAGLVSIADGDMASVREQVRDMAAGYGVDSVVAPSDFVTSRSALLHGFERVIQWMLLFTLIQALVGVVNTLLLSVGERRREFGLLRAAGATRKQLLRLVLTEGGSFAVVGTILGTIVGVLGAWVAMRSLEGFGLSGFAVPVTVVVVIALAAAGLGVMAAIVPARWASAVPPLEAVVEAPEPSTGSLAIALFKSISTRMRSLGRGRRLPEPPVEPTVPAGAPIPIWPEGSSFPAPATVDPGAGTVLPPPYVGPPVSTEPTSLDQVPVEPVPAEPVEVFASEPEAPEPVEPAVAEPVPGPTPEPEPVAPPVEEPVVTAAPGDEPTAEPVAEPTAEPTAEPVAEPAYASADEPDLVDEPVPVPERRSVFSERSRRERLTERVGPTPEVPDRLVHIAARLDPISLADGGPLLGLLVDQLGDIEVVENMVQGWVKGLPCVVARTDMRTLVLVSRFPKPLVQSLRNNKVSMSTYGPANIGTVSMSIVHGKRVLEVIGIRDRAEAAAMVGPKGSRAGSGAGYF